MVESISTVNSCKYCHSQEFKRKKYFSVLKHIPDGLDRSFSEKIILNTCKNCKSVFITDLDGIEDQNLYEKSICFDSSKETFEKSNSLKPYSSSLIPRVYEERWKDLRALDFGCGGGYFTKYLKRIVKEVEASDLDKEATSFVSENLGIQTYIWDLDDILVDRYELLSLIGVFEHFVDPEKAIKTLYSVLRKNGFLLLAFPNIDSFTRHVSKLSKHGWDMFLEPGHVTFPAKKIFLKKVEENGFILQSYFTTSHLLRGKIPFLPFRNRNIERKIFNLYSKSKTFNLVYYLLYKTLDRMKLGDISVYIFRKSN